MSTTADTTADAATASDRTAEADPVVAVDLFAGAGGLSTGLALACEALDREVELVAVNHWGPAIETHERNHPWATQLHAKVESLHPPDAVPGTTDGNSDDPHVDILVAAPECTHYSTARGGKPVTEQKRASPWHVLDWVEKLDVENVLFENVREFESWGKIEDGQPTRNGEVFNAWIDALHALGYSVDWDTLTAADYGDPTSRTRLFVIGRRGRRAAFPEPTHSEDGTAPGTKEWRPAAEIIDWSAPGDSIWQRDRPLVNNTMQRIAEGIRRHGTDRLAPFADVIADLGKADVAAMQQFVVPARYADLVARAVTQPFLVSYDGHAAAHEPGDRRLAMARPAPSSTLCLPYLLGQQSGARPRRVHKSPVPTIATRGAIGLYRPQSFVLPRNGPYRGLHSNPTYVPAARPLHTITARNHDGHLVTPYLVPFDGERDGQAPRTHDCAGPLPTVPASKSPAGVCRPTPFLVTYNGQSDVEAITDPLPTVTTRDRFALVLPDHYPWGLDIRFRMLQPRELAAAMGFPDDYEIVGNKTETTRQIGNAVPVNLAKALCRKLLTGQEPSLHTFTGRDPTDTGSNDTTDDGSRARPRARVETSAND